MKKIILTLIVVSISTGLIYQSYCIEMLKNEKAQIKDKLNHDRIKLVKALVSCGDK